MLKANQGIPVRLTKLGFIARLGGDFVNILTAAKQSVQVEMFVKMLDWATPDADGTSVDLEDPRVIGALQMLENAGLIAAGRAAEILYVPPVELPVLDAIRPSGTHRVTSVGGQVLIVGVDADGTVYFADGSWSTLDTLALQGATVEVI